MNKKTENVQTPIRGNIQFSSEDSKRFKEQIEIDSKFLMGINMYKYSLILGIEYIEEKEMSNDTEQIKKSSKGYIKK